MAGVAQQLAGLDAEAAGAIQDPLAPGALVDHTIGGSGIGEVDQTRDGQLHQHRWQFAPTGGLASLTDPSRTWHAACLSRRRVTTMLDWISLGASLLLGLLALVALVLTALGVFVLGRGVL